MPETEIKPERLMQGSGSGLNAEQLNDIEGAGYVTDSDLTDHETDTNNPHGVNAVQVGAVKNLGSVPEVLAGVIANRPSAGSGQIGRIYISTDTNQIFRDDGSNWHGLGSEPEPVTISSDTVTSGEQRVLVDTSSNMVTLTLGSSDTVSGNTISVKDQSGNAGTNNIAIETEESETIDGVSSQTISTDYGSMSVYSDGANWFIEDRV